jgi:molybdate transport system substrate-binding protein
MAHLAIPDGQRRKRVMGENVNQTLQFVKSGNADLGFVALSQVRQADGTHWIPGPSLYPPITQQALLLRDTVPAKAFMAFLDSRQARSLILSQGYGLP